MYTICIVYVDSTYRKISNCAIFQLAIHPVQSGFGAGTFFFHEIRQISHTGQFVQVRRSQVLGFQYHRYVEPIPGQFHCASTVVYAVVGIQIFPMRKQSWFTVFQ